MNLLNVHKIWNARKRERHPGGGIRRHDDGGGVSALCVRAEVEYNPHVVIRR